jgi:hypothetical protein
MLPKNYSDFQVDRKGFIEESAENLRGSEAF